jgi:hypothetical protein
MEKCSGMRNLENNVAEKVFEDLKWDANFNSTSYYL